MGGFAGILGMAAVVSGMLTYAEIQRIRTSPQYISWRTARKNRQEADNVKEFIREDEILKLAVCPIKKEIPEIPMRAPGGMIFEFDAVTEWLDNHPGEIYPGLKEPFSKEDLVYDLSHVYGVLDRIDYLKSKCLLRLGSVRSILDRQLLPPLASIIIDGYLSNEGTPALAMLDVSSPFVTALMDLENRISHIKDTFLASTDHKRPTYVKKFSKDGNHTYQMVMRK